eukprot:COSAG02_NODE_40294_length_407_cov_0.805195_1_plen_54_part_10
MRRRLRKGLEADWSICPDAPAAQAVCSRVWQLVVCQVRLWDMKGIELDLVSGNT